MPAAWIGAGAAAIGAGESVFGGGSGGGGGAGQVAQGVSNIVGGALTPGEASQLATSVNPFGQYNNQFASQLASQANQGVYGATKPNLGLQQQYDYLNNNSLPLTGALNGQGFGQQINQLISDPSSIYSTPQYQAAFGQGQNAVNATLAAQGLNASGNQLAALQSFGQSFGQNAYNTQLSQLSGLYGQALGANQQGFNQITQATQSQLGANQQNFNQLAALSGLSTGSPQAAAQILSQGYSQAGQSIGQGVGQLVNGAGNLLNGLGGSSGGYGFSTGLGTTTTGDISGSGGLFGTSAGIDNGGGFTYSGAGNTWGF